jgi:hypothetical protein
MDDLCPGPADLLDALPAQDLGVFDVACGPLRCRTGHGVTCTVCGAQIMTAERLARVAPLVGLIVVVGPVTGRVRVDASPGILAALYGAREDGVLHECEPKR